MLEATMKFDRYHATMGNFANTEFAVHNGQSLADKRAVFYITQRNFKFAPCVGHERLVKNLLTPSLDIPRLRFLKEDKAGLSLIADKLASARSPFVIRAVEPGTIIFAGEPIADIEGPFDLTQMMEIVFEHAFDEPMTFAGKAFAMRSAAGERHLSEFALRRAGSLDRAIDLTQYAFVGGFDDTSNMESGHKLGINTVGTMAHYLVQAYIDFMFGFRKYDTKGRIKHFEEVAFEHWLDAHPNGTTLLLDTLNLQLGAIHAIRAAKNSKARKDAFKYARIDSGNLAQGSRWLRQIFNANDLEHVKVLPTGDVDEYEIAKVIAASPEVSGFGIGTKLAIGVAGVIFKLCAINSHPTMKLSNTPGKETLPGQVQVWRCLDEEGFYVKDVITILDEIPQWNRQRLFALLKPFRLLAEGNHQPCLPSFHEQREYVAAQRKKFRDIQNYSVELSPSLKMSKDNLTQKMLADEAGLDGVVMIPYPASS